MLTEGSKIVVEGAVLVWLAVMVFIILLKQIIDIVLLVTRKADPPAPAERIAELKRIPSRPAKPQAYSATDPWERERVDTPNAPKVIQTIEGD